jgi:hypothetical protein
VAVERSSPEVFARPTTVLIPYRCTIRSATAWSSLTTVPARPPHTTPPIKSDGTQTRRAASPAHLRRDRQLGHRYESHEPAHHPHLGHRKPPHARATPLRHPPMTLTCLLLKPRKPRSIVSSGRHDDSPPRREYPRHGERTKGPDRRSAHIRFCWCRYRRLRLPDRGLR